MTKKKRKRITSGLLGGRGMPYPFEMRVRVVKTITEAGTSIIGAARGDRLHGVAPWLVRRPPSR